MNHFMPHLFDVDLVTVIMAYLLIRQGSGWTAIFALVQGMAVDIFSAGVVGLFTFLYLVTFLSLVLGGRFFDLLSLKGQIILISLAVFLKQILLLGLLKAFSFEITVSFFSLLPFALSALFAGLAGPLVFCLLNHIMGMGSARDLEEG
ncbi:MAG: hypothetical protein MUO52_10060 [Desulfobacterales bacterium]|nr:hypothetical protein [Desulfobacterales bacterium]